MRSPGGGEKVALKERGSPSGVAHIDQKQEVLMMSPWELRPRRSGKRKVSQPSQIQAIVARIDFQSSCFSRVQYYSVWHVGSCGV